MLDFQNSDFIVLVHTNGLGYHQNAPFGKDSSIDFLWEVLSTLGLQGMEREGRGQEGREERVRDSCPVLSLRHWCLISLAI